METKIVKFGSNFCASVLAAVVFVLTAKLCVDVESAFVFHHQDNIVLFATTFKAYCWNFGMMLVAAFALVLLNVRKKLKADIIDGYLVFGIAVLLFFTGALIVALLNNGAYFKALAMVVLSGVHIGGILFVGRGCIDILRSEEEQEAGRPAYLRRSVCRQMERRYSSKQRETEN